MSTIEIVENPRRKKRGRRRLSRKQIAAGFGGKRRKTTRRRPRRRNPAMAALGNPKRRRRSYRVSHRVTRRRRNPGLGMLGIDLSAAMWVAAGMFGTQTLPGLVRRYAWAGLPSTGITGHLVKAASAVALGFGIGKLTNRRNGSLAAAGGLAMVMVDLFKEHVAPMIGLSGLDYGYSGNLPDIADVAGYEAMDGYVQASSGVGYNPNPTGAYSA